MSMRGTQLPAYNPAMPPEEKEKVVQESLRMLGQALMGTGAKVIGQRLMTKPIGATITPNFPGELSLSFVGTDGLTDISVRIPFVLAGGAAVLRGSLWLDDVEVDRNESRNGQLNLRNVSLPPGGNHTLKVRLLTDAGTATLFSSTAWGAIWVTETLL